MHFVYEVRSKKSERLSRTSKLWSYINDGETLIQSLKRTLFNSIFPSGSSCFLRIKKHCFFNPFFFLSLVEGIVSLTAWLKLILRKVPYYSVSHRIGFPSLFFFSLSLFLSLSLSFSLYLSNFLSLHPSNQTVSHFIDLSHHLSSWIESFLLDLKVGRAKN